MSRLAEKYAGRAVPRYTSYPTAPHFNDTVDAADYTHWLASLDRDEPVSLYLHVPFCRELCWYCGCNMKLAKRDEPIAQYAAMLRREIVLLAQHLPGRMRVSHIHWGGGTPTAMAPGDLMRTMQTVRDHFDLVTDAELAIESDPRTLTREMADMIGRLGFTRASFGVQEFDPQVQLAINRVQPPDMVARSVDGLRAVGVDAINFDLIYGLPFQTTEKLLETVRLSVEMRPDRIALFGYAHVPWAAKKQRLIDETALPGASERLEQAQEAARALVDAGYVAIGLDHFARPGDEMVRAAAKGSLRRNFQGYTTDRADSLLGLGATSIGKTAGGFCQNIAETGAWSRSVEAGRLPVGRGYAFKNDDRLRAEVIEQLMCQHHVDLDLAAQRHGAPKHWYFDALPSLAEFDDDGLITMDAGRMRVTQRGEQYIRVIASAFDSYLTHNQTRHAVAV
ncbi:MAG: oxygen-independent coproporphyrinogen III oxidase [Pseudomonadota bacterium]